jgi:hypothetical protein
MTVPGGDESLTETVVVIGSREMTVPVSKWESQVVSVSGSKWEEMTVSGSNSELASDSVRQYIVMPAHTVSRMLASGNVKQ